MLLEAEISEYEVRTETDIDNKNRQYGAGFEFHVKINPESISYIDRL